MQYANAAGIPVSCWSRRRDFLYYIFIKLSRTIKRF
nr:MAG TPA: hypothetical protein [Caudoviricetes sp.]